MTHHRSYKRGQRRESKRGERSSLASKGASKAPLESGAQTFSESAVSGPSSAALMTRLLLPLIRPSLLVRREPKVAKVQVPQKILNPRSVLQPRLGLGKAANIRRRRLAWLKDHDGIPPIRFPSGRQQTLVSAPGPAHPAKLTN